VTGLAQLGGPVACIGLALLIVLPARRDRIAALGFTALGTCLLGVAVAPHKPLIVLGGAFAALGLGVGLAGLFRLWPWLLPLLALACVPARVGVHVGDSSSKLLVPLYVVVLGGAILFAWQLVEGDERSRELRLASWPLAGLIAWTGLSLAWSKDVQEGAIELLAFVVPFAVLALTVARLPWSRLGARVLYAEVTLMAVVFAAVGFYQYDTRDIFQNPKVITANAYAPFFRVNSVFWDPSVYGRFLVLAMLPSVVLLALGRLGRLTAAAVTVLVVMWAGLLISFSQSSFFALLVVVAAGLFLFWRWKSLAVVIAAAAVLAGIAVAQPQVRQRLQHHTIHGLNEASSGRASLVAQGIRIAEANPIRGVGVGGFKKAYAKRVHLKGKEPKTAASHNTAVTVAAETGVPGLVLFAWLLGAAFGQAFRGRRSALSLAAGIGLAAIFCHSLFYNAFFEDPMTWGLFGLAALGAPVALARASWPVVPPPREQREREVVPA